MADTRGPLAEVARLYPHPIAELEMVAARKAAIVEGALDAIVSIDRYGYVVEFNPAAERLFGWRRDEALGRRLAELIIPAEYAEAHAAGLARYLQDGTAPVIGRRLELPAVRRDGSELTLELMINRTVHGDHEEFTGFARDITELRETQRQLLASQRRLDAIARHSPQVKILCGSSSEPSSFLGGEGILGYQPATPLPHGFLGLVHPDEVAAAETYMMAVRDGELSARSPIDLRLREASGRYRLCEVRAENLSNVPEIGGVLVRATDVETDRAQRRELEDRTWQMRTLIENLGSAVLLEDADRRVLVTNQAFIDMFALPGSPDTVIGSPSAQAIGAAGRVFADPARFHADFASIAAADQPQLGDRFALMSGGTVERDYLPVTSSEGRPAGHLWVFRDITRQIIETEMLTDQNRSLEQLAALKNEFVARVSHELRSPLTSVVSFAEMLADDALGTLTPEQADFIEIIQRNSHRLLRLIDDLLLVAKLESHTLPLSLGLVDPSALVGQVVTELEPRATERQISLRFHSEPGPRIRGDSLRLQQVVSNLVTNAINYSSPGGVVGIRAVPNPTTRHWDISVRDNGIGIAAEDLPRLFEAFFRTSSGSEKSSGGTGLGLAIVRLLVDEHQGTLSVESTPGIGTTMTVHLPSEEV